MQAHTTHGNAGHSQHRSQGMLAAVAETVLKRRHFSDGCQHVHAKTADLAA